MFSDCFRPIDPKGPKSIPGAEWFMEGDEWLVRVGGYTWTEEQYERHLGDRKLDAEAARK